MIETEKLDRVKRVIAHHGGEVVEESALGQDVQVQVIKAGTPSAD